MRLSTQPVGRWARRARVSIALSLSVLTVAVAPSTSVAKPAPPKSPIAGATTNGLPLTPASFSLIPTTPTSHPLNADEFTSNPVGLTSRGFAEDEYLVSGTARVYKSVPSTDYETKVLGTSNYVTRAIVRRPANMKRWSGRVIVEYNNATDNIDDLIIWTRLFPEIFRNNDVYIGFTGKPNTMLPLQKFDPSRYSTLSMPTHQPATQCGRAVGDPAFNPSANKTQETGLLWDMWSQIGLALRAKAPANPLGSPAKEIYAVGESQSAGALMTYYRFFGGARTKLANGQPVFDGNLAETGGASTSGALNQCSGSLPSGDPQRTTTTIPDRGTPYFAVNSQADAPATAPAPSSSYRLWDLPGANHVDREMYDHLYPVKADLIAMGGPGHPDPWPWLATGPFPICYEPAPLCFNPGGWYTDDAQRPEIPLPAAERMAYRWLQKWAVKGIEPPAPPYETRTASGARVFDADGNATGGLRMPEMVAPIAKYDGCAWGDSLLCHHPFSAERLLELYPTHKAYVRQFSKAAKGLAADGFLTHYDAKDEIDRARERPIP